MIQQSWVVMKETVLHIVTVVTAVWLINAQAFASPTVSVEARRRGDGAPKHIDSLTVKLRDGAGPVLHIKGATFEVPAVTSTNEYVSGNEGERWRIVAQYDLSGRAVLDNSARTPVLVVEESSLGRRKIDIRSLSEEADRSLSRKAVVAAVTLIEVNVFVRYHQPTTVVILVPQNDTTVVVDVDLLPWFDRIKNMQIDVEVRDAEMRKITQYRDGKKDTLPERRMLSYSLSPTVSEDTTWSRLPDRLFFSSSITTTQFSRSETASIYIDTASQSVTSVSVDVRYQSLFREYEYEISCFAPSLSVVSTTPSTKLIDIYWKHISPTFMTLRYEDFQQWPQMGHPDYSSVHQSLRNWEGNNELQRATVRIDLYE